MMQDFLCRSAVPSCQAASPPPRSLVFIFSLFCFANKRVLLLPLLFLMLLSLPLLPVSIPPPHRMRHQANFHLGRPAFVNSDHSAGSSKELIFPLWRGELRRRLMHMWSLFDAPIVYFSIFSCWRSHIARKFVSQLTCCFGGIAWIKNENKRRYFFLIF